MCSMFPFRDSVGVLLARCDGGRCVTVTYCVPGAEAKRPGAMRRAVNTQTTTGEPCHVCLEQKE
jgi:hypothetical protein